MTKGRGTKKIKRAKRLKQLRRTRKSLDLQKKWAQQFPLIGTYNINPMTGLISFEYNDEQFAEWEPLETSSCMEEYDCYPAASVAIRLFSHRKSRKISRISNVTCRGRTPLDEIPEQIAKQINIPDSSFHFFERHEIKAALKYLQAGFATLLYESYPNNTAHIYIVYRDHEYGKLMSFEPQRCLNRRERFRRNSHVVEYGLLHSDNIESPSDDNTEHNGIASGSGSASGNGSGSVSGSVSGSASGIGNGSGNGEPMATEQTHSTIPDVFEEASV